MLKDAWLAIRVHWWLMWDQLTCLVRGHDTRPERILKSYHARFPDVCEIYLHCPRCWKILDRYKK